VKTTPCKGCGKPIVFVEVYKEDGKVVSVPHDVSAPVYTATSYDAESTPTVAVRDHGAFVSHFKTCPNAADFSSSKKKP
jgi:hypothetical protein